MFEFLNHISSLPLIVESLEDERAGRLFKNMSYYQRTGESPDFADKEDFLLWIAVKHCMDHSEGGEDNGD